MDEVRDFSVISTLGELSMHSAALIFQEVVPLLWRHPTRIIILEDGVLLDQLVGVFVRTSGVVFSEILSDQGDVLLALAELIFVQNFLDFRSSQASSQNL